MYVVSLAPIKLSNKFANDYHRSVIFIGFYDAEYLGVDTKHIILGQTVFILLQYQDRAFNEPRWSWIMSKTSHEITTWRLFCYTRKFTV